MYHAPMARREERFRKYQEAGADFLENARARAEEFLHELARASDVTQKQAQGALDELLEGSRRGTELLLKTIQKEIASQLSLLGLATKEDLRGLERRLSGKAPAPAKKASAAGKAPAKKAAANKAAAKQAPAKKAAAKKAPA